MKRLKAVLLAALIAVLGFVFLTACGGGQAGVYKFSYMRMTEGATSYEIRAGESYLSIIFSEDAFVIELKEDGTATASIDMFGQQETVSGTWAVNAEDQNKVDITFDGEPATFEYDGKTLYGSMDGTELELVKQ